MVVDLQRGLASSQILRLDGSTLRKLLPAHGPDAETLSACFGRKSQKRSDQITAILATLRALGHLE